MAGEVSDGELNMMRMPLSDGACGGLEEAKERKELLLLGLDMEEQEEEALLQGRDLSEGRGKKKTTVRQKGVSILLLFIL